MIDEESETDNSITDKSGDRNYFTMIPNFIDDIGLSVYSHRLYVHLKRVCGETNGVCWQSTRTIAEACGMSTGQVSKSKTELINANLINLTTAISNGKIYHKVVVTDVWSRNTKHFDKRSPGERIDTPTTNPPPVGDRSYSERDRSYSERDRSPGETKKNPIKKNSIKKTPENEISKSEISASRKKGDALDGMMYYNGLLQKYDCASFPEDLRPLVQAVCDLFDLKPPRAGSKDFGFWIKGTRSLTDACAEFGVKAIQAAYYASMRDPYTVTSPTSLVNTCRAEAGKLRKANTFSTPAAPERTTVGDLISNRQAEFENTLTTHPNT